MGQLLDLSHIPIRFFQLLLSIVRHGLHQKAVQRTFHDDVHPNELQVNRQEFI